MDNQEIKKIGIIGFGNMGSSIYKALEKNFPVESLFACTRSKKSNAHNVHMLETESLASQVDVAVIAVKPQDFQEVVDCVGDTLKDKLVISIMAGVSLQTLSEKLGASRVVRSMPNLGALVSSSSTAWMGSSNLTEDDKILTRGILDSFGRQIEVVDESMIDKATALFGSGPAYFYYLAQTIEEQAIKWGFDEYTAKNFALNTLIASSKFAELTGETAENLISKVASKGGTTEAALNKFEVIKLKTLLKSGMNAAYRRSKQLGK